MGIGVVHNMGGGVKERTLSGVPVSVATFNGKAFPLPSLKVAVECTQEGSGTPSPDNVRAITGYSAINISQSGADTSTPTVHTINLGGTYYVGEYNARTGLLTVTHGVVDLGSVNFSFNSTHGFFYTNMPADSADNIIGGRDGMSDIYKLYQGNFAGFKLTDSSFTYNNSSIGGAKTIGIRDTYTTDTDVFKTRVTGHYVIYELATPTTVQVPPCPLDSLNGVNNIWADTGDITELKYLK